MEQYISKSALVVEIENLENTYKKCPTHNSYEEGLKDGRLIGYKDALHKIDILEVKEGLTWEDIPTILTISERLKTGWWFVDRTKDIGTQAFWEEVLKRFKAQKGE